jgi:hypothetical protein
MAVQGPDAEQLLDKRAFGQNLRRTWQGKIGTKLSRKESGLHGRFRYGHETTELQICQGGLESHGHTRERSG